MSIKPIEEQNSKFYTTNLSSSSSTRKLSEFGAALNIRLFNKTLEKSIDSLSKSQNWNLRWLNSFVYSESKYWFESDKKENFYQNHFFDSTSTDDLLVYKPLKFSSKIELNKIYLVSKINGYLGYDGLLNKVSQNGIDSTYYVSHIFWGIGMQYQNKYGLYDA